MCRGLISYCRIESGEIQHYCCVKRVNALLFNSKNNHKHHCMMCFIGFTEDLLENHEKYCNGLNDKPIKT